jgi:hypothetical protein
MNIKSAEKIKNFSELIKCLYLAIVGTGITFSITKIFVLDENHDFDIWRLVFTFLYLILGYIPTVLRFSLGAVNLLSSSEKVNKSIFLASFWLLFTSVLFLIHLVFAIQVENSNRSVVLGFYLTYALAFLSDIIVLWACQPELFKFSNLKKAISPFKWFILKYDQYENHLHQWLDSSIWLLLILSGTTCYFYSNNEPFYNFYLLSTTVLLFWATCLDFFHNWDYYFSGYKEVLEVNNKIMIFVVSPLSGQGNPIKERINLERAKRICREIVVQRSDENVLYIPFAPHVYFPQFLYESETFKGERELGINCGLEILKLCHEVWVFTERGQETTGMKAEIEQAKKLNKPIKYHTEHGMNLGF